jgi:uncharacterized membrane protein
MKIMIGEPRVVEAGRGASWWSGGYRIFASSVGTWIGIMIVYIIISVVIGVIPYVGDVGHWLLTPVFMGGLMLGCQEIERGGSLRVAHLFEGFQGTNFVPLMIIGAVNIAIALGIAALAYATFLGGVKLSDMARLGTSGDPFGAFFGSTRALTGTSILGILLVLVIASVFAMLNWFAPALVALRGATAIEAMKLSFLACLRNWVPFLVYGLIAIVAIVAAVLAMGAIGLMLGAGALLGAGVAGGLGALLGFAFLMIAFVLILALIVGPIVYGSIYESYKDTLGADDTALGNPAYQ